MQKQHLEIVQRLFCWSVRCCNVPTQHQRLKQYHSPPVYFGTCSFKLLLTEDQCSPHRLLSRGHYLPRTCPKRAAISWDLSPQMLRCEIRVLSYGFPLGRRAPEQKATLEGGVVHGGPPASCSLYAAASNCLFPSSVWRCCLTASLCFLVVVVFYWIAKFELLSNEDCFWTGFSFLKACFHA